jgi:hypothetical protein
MKLSTKQLKQIIIEELRGVLMEVKYGQDDTPAEYSLWNGTDHVPYPMGPPEGIPANFMLKLQQLAADDPAQAAELAAGLVQDDEKAKEISDYLYDIAIAHITKKTRLSAIVDERNNEIVIFEEEMDGELYFANNFPLSIPRSEVYDYMKQLAKVEKY